MHAGKCLLQFSHRILHSLEKSVAQRAAAGAAGAWLDDNAENAQRLADHINSPEYKLLHAPTLGKDDLGGFGGEPGFETSPRMFVDPDRPALRQIYTLAALSKNLRYSRYGAFKPEFHIIDVDKLLRHARLIPPVDKVLNDFIMLRVPLPDRSCAAILRHGLRTLNLIGEQRRAQFHKLEEAFERMLITSVPPIEVGIQAHTEMVRVCTACQRFDEGFNWYSRRAKEEANAGKLALTADYYDALVALCAAANRLTEACAAFEELLLCGRRALTPTLDNMLIIAGRMGDAEAGESIWRLYEFYARTKTPRSFEARFEWCARCKLGSRCMEVLNEADRQQITVTLRSISWLLFALRHKTGLGTYVLQLLSQLRNRGLSADYETVTYALLYAKQCHDSAVAVEVIEQYAFEAAMTMTPEIVLLLMQTCALSQCDAVGVAACTRALEGLLRVTRTSPLMCDIMSAYIRLLAGQGLLGTAMSTLKQLPGLSVSLTGDMVTDLLHCNFVATKPSGSIAVAEQLLQLLIGLQRQVSKQTLTEIANNLTKFGASKQFVSLCAHIGVSVASKKNRVHMRVSKRLRLSPYHELDDFAPDPDELRALRTSWTLDRKSIELSKLGQFIPRPKLQEGRYGTLNRRVPFDGKA